MSLNQVFHGTPTSIFRDEQSRRKLSFCQGSPVKTSLDSRSARDFQSSTTNDTFTCHSGNVVLGNYDQIVECILESLKAGSVSLDDFERGIDAVRAHLSVSRRTFSFDMSRGIDVATPRAINQCTPVQQRQRSLSMNIRPGPLHFEDEDSSGRCDRKWSIDTTSTSLPLSCTNERRLKLAASIPCGSPHVGCSPAPNIPLHPASPSTFSLSRPRILSHSLMEPSLLSPGTTPLITPVVSAVSPVGSHPIRLSDVTLGDIVGSGSYGVVYRARVNATGQLIVVKVIPIHADSSTDLEQVNALLNELQLLQSLHHSRIVSYLGNERVIARSLPQLSSACVDGSEQLLIFCEYMSGGSLASTIKQFGPLDEKAIALHTKHILEGLVYLHENRVCHRDLKCDNILIDVHGTCKLADFGCSKKLDTSPEGGTVIMKSLKGTIPFMSPETLSGMGYGRASDVWALGCLVLEMALGRNPWGKFDNIMQAMYRIAMGGVGPDIPDFLGDSCRNFVHRCLHRDPKVRPTAAELLDDPFVKNP